MLAELTKFTYLFIVSSASIFWLGGGIAQFVSRSPTMLGTQVRIPVGAWLRSPNACMRGEEITSCKKNHIASVSLTDWCIMIKIKETKEDVSFHWGKCIWPDGVVPVLVEQNPFSRYDVRSDITEASKKIAGVLQKQWSLSYHTYALNCSEPSMHTIYLCFVTNRFSRLE